MAPQICLGAEAKDELHVVAVDSKNTYGQHKPVPIAALRTSVLPMVRAAKCLACSPWLWGDNFIPGAWSPLSHGQGNAGGSFPLWLCPSDCLQTPPWCREAAHPVTVPRGLTWGAAHPGWARGALSSGSLQISLKGLELVPPVTFVLKCGAGPVYLSGQHIICECTGLRVGWGCTGDAPGSHGGFGGSWYPRQGCFTPGMGGLLVWGGD